VIDLMRIVPKEEVCIGCRLCEIHCIVQHSKSKDIVKAHNIGIAISLSGG